MGKYMKKAVMEISQAQAQQASSVVGVRTRARTLALQPNPDLFYLQLRNRRLEKPSFQPSSPPPHPPSRVRLNADKGCFRHFHNQHHDHVQHEDDEASFGENNLEFLSNQRGSRESTPCSLIRDSEAIGTPGSTTRPTCSATANRHSRNMERAIPTTSEMEDFFAGFELQQQELFLEKYNYDIVNDIPLSGRYDWVRVDN